MTALAPPSTKSRIGNFLRRNGGGLMERLLSYRAQRRKEAKFHADYERFVALSKAAARDLSVHEEDLFPCLDEASSETAFDRHYTYHPAWAARVLARTRPAKHIDISSILNFSTIASAFVPIEFYDFRPAPIRLDGLASGQANLLALKFADASVESLSCMHVLEHIGLGRYGDPLDPNGDLTAMAELKRVLAPGGNLLVVVPVGKPRVHFNAHRVYDHRAIQDAFAGLQLVEFALVPDGDASDGLLFGPSDDLVRAQAYGCGCFWFRKPAV